MRKKRKYLVEWSEVVNMNCSVEIEAESENDARQKWHKGEYGDYERDEFNNSFDDDCAVREVKDNE